jgi:transcriptional regulator with XRE-family HTH domain
MTQERSNLLHDPQVRRVFEEELAVGEAIDTLAALLQSQGLSQTELAKRLGVSRSRVSQILSGAENLTLRSLGALGWALGVRFEVAPTPMADRTGTPAMADKPAPAWLTALRTHRRSALLLRDVHLPPAESLEIGRPDLRVIDGALQRSRAA